MGTANEFEGARDLFERAGRLIEDVGDTAKKRDLSQTDNLLMRGRALLSEIAIRKEALEKRADNPASAGTLFALKTTERALGELSETLEHLKMAGEGEALAEDVIRLKRLKDAIKGG